MIKHTYKEGTRQPDKDNGLDHLGDSLGYAVYQNFAVKRDFGDIERNKPSRRSTGRML